MKIASSVVAMASQHELVEKDVEQESLQVWDTRGSNGAKKVTSMEEFLQQGQQDIVEISDQAKALFADQSQGNQGIAKKQPSFELSEGDKTKLRLLQILIESLGGKHIKFKLPLVSTEEETTSMKVKNDIFISQTKLTSSGPQPLGWGIEYHSYQLHTEQESTFVQAVGSVRTTDGREINFSADIAMNRQFSSEQRVDLKAGDALRDPLVINFTGQTTQLTNKKIDFDLDSNGTTDKISFVQPGSGFLALDLNQDGKINNGKELFGPDSGNGFADLAAYDSDGNQWIDENDPIYNKLRIWSKDEEGKDQLSTLGQKGVGAIYLGSIRSEFAIKDGSNQLQGQVRQTGIFLKEDGQVGTMQHVDLAV